jgi:hypothetical protein
VTLEPLLPHLRHTERVEVPIGEQVYNDHAGRLTLTIRK